MIKEDCMGSRYSVSRMEKGSNASGIFNERCNTNVVKIKKVALF